MNLFLIYFVDVQDDNILKEIDDMHKEVDLV